MSLSEMQACLARLYVDDLFRELCKRDWSLAHRYYALDDAEIDALERLDKERLDAFAEAVREKRLNKLRSGYRLLYRLPIKRIADFETRFCQLHQPRPHDSYFEDLLSFGRFMEGTLDRYPDRPVFAPDLVRYEHAFQQARALGRDGAVEAVQARDCPLSRPFVVTRSFSFDVLALDRQLTSDKESVPDCPLSELHLAFPRCPPESDSRVLKINRNAKRLLDLCDGRTPIPEIVKLLSLPEPALDAETDVRGTLAQFSDAGLVQL